TGALSLLFTKPTVWLGVLVALSAAAMWAMPRLWPWFSRRYGDRVIEPEIKGALAVLLAMMYLASLAGSLAVLPAFLLGLAVAQVFREHRPVQQRFRVIAFALLTPLFFLKSRMSLSLPVVLANLGAVGALLATKL